MFDGWTYTEEGDLVRPCGRVCSKTPNLEGYLVTKYKCKQYKQHRIIFFLCYGYWPEIVDHIDQDKSNNRPSNLREATASLNGHNRKVTKLSRTGIKGVFPTKDGYYAAQIKVNNRTLCRVFKTLEQAKLQRELWEVEYGVVASR